MTAHLKRKRLMLEGVHGCYPPPALTERQFDDLLLRAADRMKAKKYLEAVALYSVIIDSTDHKLYDLLHLRCRAWTKAGRRDLALVEAKRMIRLEYWTTKGYLETARLEVMLSKPEQAIKVLSRALQIIKNADDRSLLRTRLEHAEQLVHAQVVASKRRDILTALPREVTELILAHLEYHEVVRLLRVSKAWHSLMASLKQIRYTVDTRQARRQLNSTQLRAAFRRLHPGATFFAFGLLDYTAADLAKAELSRCVRYAGLSTLYLDRHFTVWPIRFDKFRSLTWLRIGEGVIVSRESFENMFSWLESPASQNLEALELYSSGPVTWDNDGNCTAEMLLKSLKDCRKLKRLAVPPSHRMDVKNLRANVCTRNLEYLYLADCESVFSDLAQYADLKHLELHHVRFLPGLTLPRLGTLIWKVSAQARPRVEESSLEDLTVCALEGNSNRIIGQGYTESCIEQILIAPVLKHLTIVGVVDRLADLFWISREFNSRQQNASVTHFVFQGDVKDDTASTLASFFPALEVLEIRFAYSMTGSFFSSLIGHPGCKLRSIKIDRCGKVGSDIVPWAATRGVVVNLIRAAEYICESTISLG